MHTARKGRDRAAGWPGWKSGWRRVFLFLDTDDFSRDYADYTSRGVTFVESPRVESYGIVAVFEDLYGNRWDLIQHTGNSGIETAVDTQQA
jgi:hypothetical protein